MIISDIIVTADTTNVQANIEYKSVIGFELCVYAKNLIQNPGAALSWKASENITVSFRVTTSNLIVYPVDYWQ